jgi:choline dehydrogenase-like flavoprotein
MTLLQLSLIYNYVDLSHDSDNDRSRVIQGKFEPFEILANKEVVLSAGAIQSPQLLMVSGVGPSDVLGNYGIPVIADRPGVGSNLHRTCKIGCSLDRHTKSTSSRLQSYKIQNMRARL